MTKAIILAAGRGIRMGDATIKQPKCLLKVNGKILIESQLQVLGNAGIDEIAIVTGYKSEMLSGYNLKQFHNYNWQNTNMVTSLFTADEWLSKHDCIIVYSDILYDEKIIQLLIESSHKLSLAYFLNWRDLWSKRFNNPLQDLENFKLSNDNLVTLIGGRAASIDEIEGQYMGIFKTTPNSWNDIRRLISKSNKELVDRIDMTTLFSLMIQEMNYEILGIEHSGLFNEFDNLKDLEVAFNNFGTDL